MSSMTPARCADHPATFAVWTCTACDRELCPLCAVPDGVAGSIDALCAPCGGIARRRVVPATVRPAWLMLPAFAGALIGN